MVLFADSVTLVGPTASGKTAAAIEVAKRNEGVDIVSVDSMTVYREMNVGTAKPSAAEIAGNEEESSWARTFEWPWSRKVN